MAQFPRELVAIMSGMGIQHRRQTQKSNRKSNAANSGCDHLTLWLADNVPIDQLENGLPWWRASLPAGSNGLPITQSQTQAMAGRTARPTSLHLQKRERRPQ
jgi:hypothetical protein